MNKLLIGTADKTEQLLETKLPFLLIDDGPIADAFLKQFPKAKLFDPTVHSFNPLKNIDYKGARDFAEAVYTASPQGENTLTVRNGKRALARVLLANPTRLDKLPRSTDTQEANDTIDDLLLSPVLRRVLCGSQNIFFKGSVVARLNRAELGDFDAFILAMLLIGQCKGHVVLPDGGFYLRDFHMSLIRQDRLTVGLSYLDELSPKLQQAVLNIKDKTIYRTSVKDAERLIFFTQHTEPRNIFEQTGEQYLTGH